MAKGYIHRWQPREDYSKSLITDVWFDSRPEYGAIWDTKEEAEIDCRLFDSYSITIPSTQGDNYTCKQFTVEARKSGGFVIFCDAPFISVDTTIRNISATKKA
jgi:hypothetical protein